MIHIRVNNRQSESLPGEKHAGSLKQFLTIFIFNLFKYARPADEPI